MDPSAVAALRAIVATLRDDPAKLHAPELAFFRDYLQHLGADVSSHTAHESAANGGSANDNDWCPVGVQDVQSIADYDTLRDKAIASRLPHVIDFSASWCPPCKAIAPIYASLAQTYARKIVFVKVDVDEVQDLATRFDVHAMPTFKFVDTHGQIIGEVQGADSGALRSSLDKLVAAAAAASDPNKKFSSSFAHHTAKDGSFASASSSATAHGPGAKASTFSSASAGAHQQPNPHHDKQDEEMQDGKDKDDDDEDDVDENAEVDDEQGLEPDPEVIPPAERDSPPYPPVGPIDNELSESDMEKQISLKGQASELAAAGDYKAALAKWNEVIAMKASPLTLAKRADVLLKLKMPNAAVSDCDAALKLNPDSGKALKTRGKAHRLLGNWEQATSDLNQGNTIDFDEESAATLKLVEPRWHHIREKRLRREARERDLSAKREANARAKARAEAQREYEQQQARAESSDHPDETFQMPGGGFGLPPGVAEKLKDPKVLAKLQTVMSKLQSGNMQEAIGEAMKHIDDPDVGPVIQAVLGSMGGGAGMPGFGGAGSAGGAHHPAAGAQPPSGPSFTEEVD